MPAAALSHDQVAAFIETGFVRVRDAVAPEVVARGREVLWREMGLAESDRGGWDAPVRRVLPGEDGPFGDAFASAALGPALDQLVGEGAWLPRPNLGIFVVRFPHPDAPDDTGWHVEGGFLADGSDEYRVNVSSRGRGLLMLFLYSDVGADDGPTRIRVGSHLDLPPLLQAAGPQGLTAGALAPLAAAASASRPEVLATGAGGDVYLCHPFLVHAAQAHRGAAPRFMAQPPLSLRSEFDLERSAESRCAVEAAIRRALGLV